MSEDMSAHTGALQVIVADHAGACYGVKRALALADEACVSGQNAFTLGPLIHNPQVVSELDRRGVHSCETLDEVPDGATVIIRSHGVAAPVLAEAHARGLHVVDATCPHVSQAQQAARRLREEGRFVVVVGEEGHPEVEGIRSYAGDDSVIAVSADELGGQLPARVGVVVQTTQSREVLTGVVDELRRRGLDLEVADTVCFATRERQQAAAALASKADCMIVIGGRNSGNTKRLRQICEHACANTHHIERAEEIEEGWFEGCGIVGITAGASTPQSQIDVVKAAIQG